MTEIIFQDGGKEPLEIPVSASDFEQMDEATLREKAEIMAYALQHGSGATVRLALPFAKTVSYLAGTSGENHASLIDEVWNAGQNLNRLGTITVQ